LYNRYASPYNLWEASLAIVRCANHDDPALVHKLWEKIIESVAVEDVSALSDKIRHLGRLYYPSDTIFPIGFLVDMLERVSAQRERRDIGWVVSTLRDVGVPFAVLFHYYNAVLRSMVFVQVMSIDLYVCRSQHGSQSNPSCICLK